jgi:hypothetical protein
VPEVANPPPPARSRASPPADFVPATSDRRRQRGRQSWRSSYAPAPPMWLLLRARLRRSYPRRRRNRLAPLPSASLVLSPAPTSATAAVLPLLRAHLPRPSSFRRSPPKRSAVRRLKPHLRLVFNLLHTVRALIAADSVPPLSESSHRHHR